MLGIAQTAISFVALLPLGVILRITAGNVAAAVSFTLIAVIALYIAQFAVIGRLALGVPALVVDRDGPLRAIGRSLRLTAGHTWSTGVVLFTASLLSLALSLVITIPVLIVVALTLPDAAAAVGVVVSYIAVGLAAYTFFSALLVVLFVDGRVRAEGLDLELTANEVGFPSLAFSVLPPSTAPWAASPSGPHR
jgi:membrane-anchored glycerophosphoryl diester phosphodiesterase (GDPDase)